jgi:hypothetical protein
LGFSPPSYCCFGGFGWDREEAMACGGWESVVDLKKES